MATQEPTLLEILVDIVRLYTARWKRDLPHLKREVREICLSSEKRPDDAGELETVATSAYKLYVEWFGPPKDPQKLCEVRGGLQRFSYCAYNRLLRRYIISIGDHVADSELRRLYCAHEMYHRVTLRGRITANAGHLNRELWVGELMAHLASHKAMRELGDSGSINNLECIYRRKKPAMSFESIQATRRKPLSITSKERIYPPGFETGVIRLGMGLSQLVSWQEICRLIEANSLEEWITSLPEKSQPLVKRLFEFPQEEAANKSEVTANDSLRMAMALSMKGDFESAISEFYTALSLQPYLPKARTFLGIALEESGQTKSAYHAYLQAVRLEPSYFFPRFQLGCLCRKQRAFEDAIRWLREAAEVHPTHPRVRLLLGYALYDGGDTEAAYAEWNRAIELDADGAVGKLALRAFTEYPDEKISAPSTADFSI